MFQIQDCVVVTNFTVYKHVCWYGLEIISSYYIIDYMVYHLLDTVVHLKKSDHKYSAKIRLPSSLLLHCNAVVSI